MSDKENDILEKIAVLPERLQDKILARLDGAALAVETLGAGRQERDDKEGDA